MPFTRRRRQYQQLTEFQPGRLTDKIPTRLVVAIMSFFACWCLYMLRLNVSVTIIAMVQPPAGKENKTVGDFGPRYEWGEKIQGDVLAAFSYGFFITQFPGGIIAEHFGSRLVVFVSLLVMAVFTILTPFSADIHWGAVMAARVIIGLAGAIYPALHCLIARWAPPEEKSRFIWALFGGSFGTVISFPVIGLLVEGWGWRESFYVCGVIVLFFCIFWIWLIQDYPEKHPRINEQELTYIEERIGTNVQKSKASKKRTRLPILRIMTSPPFLALTLCHYGNLWGLFLLLTLAPKFMSDVLHFDILRSGGLSSLPCLARFGFGFIFSSVGDYLVKHETLSRTMIRKIFTIFSHLAAGVLMFLIGYMDEYLWLTVLMMTLSLGMNGAATVSNLSNHHDLAPNYAGSLYGIMNEIGVTSGFIAPMVSGRILEHNNGIYEWRILFIIGALFYIITGVIFIIFGSGNVQPWNTPKEAGDDEAAQQAED